MSGLVGYGSSDEENSQDEQQKSTIDQRSGPPGNTSVRLSENAFEEPLVKSAAIAPKGVVPATVANEPAGNSQSSHTSLPGPSLGPSLPTTSAEENGTTPGTQSPHTTYKEAVQNATLPTVPNFDIPPSPPGSPPPGVDAKIQQFLKLKKQGIHFNEKLASSSALKNPSLLNKLIANAGLGEVQQYSNTLSREYWDPSQFQDWMFKENLEQARLVGDKRRQEASNGKGRSSIDFTPEQKR